MGETDDRIAFEFSGQLAGPAGHSGHGHVLGHRRASHTRQRRRYQADVGQRRIRHHQIEGPRRIGSTGQQQYRSIRTTGPLSPNAPRPPAWPPPHQRPDLQER